MLAKPNSCTPCELYGTGAGYSELEGCGRLPLLISAEALGASEERDGLPLRPYARAGGVFQRVLDDLHAERSAFTLTNIVRCRPPDNELLGASYERTAIDRCTQYFDTAVSERKPSVILALGAIPTRELAAPPYNALPASAVRGYALPSRYAGITVIGTYHPSYIARGAWNLYGVMLHDVARAIRYARNGLPKPMETQYEIQPGIDRVLQYYHYLRDNPTFPNAYDVETPAILGQPEPPRWADKRIVQIQFSHRPGYAIVLPYEGEYRLLSHRILALPNPKWGWNSRTSDEVCLRADGVNFGGEQHDLMLAFGHLQPDFAGGKESEADDREKNIPARLLNLQAAASFFCEGILPWKHDWSDVPLYGAKDADYTHRCGVAIFDALQRRGLYDGYMEYKYRLRYALDDLGARGLPVDRQAQTALASYIAAQSSNISTRVQIMVPDELKGIHPKEGHFKTLSPKIRKLIPDYDPANPPQVAYSNFTGHLINEDGAWYVRKLFNPNSTAQLVAYCKHQGYKIPKHIESGNDTVNKDALEQLVEQTGDELLTLIQKQRKLTKLGGTYAAGSWIPQDDDRVHPTFGMLTGSGQTTAKDPNVQQYPEHYDPNDDWLAELMKMVKGCIKAEPGHTLLKVDMRAFHARMQGWLAEDAAYYRLASMDCHSFVTAHYLELPDRHELMSLNDADLSARLKEIKREHQHERNYKVKRVSFLNQYLGGAQKAASILKLPVIEVQYILDLIADLFPKAFKEYPDSVRRMMRNCHVQTAFGCHRFIWDRKIQEGVATMVANSAHCHIQSALIRLFNQGVFSAYEAVNFAHDSLWMHPLNNQVESALNAVRTEFERPSTVLVNSLGPFTCLSDAECGPSMIEMDSL